MNAAVTMVPGLADAPVEDRLAFAVTEVAQKCPERVAIVADAGSNDRRTVEYAAVAASIVDLERRLDAVRPAGLVARARRAESLVAIAAACGRQHVPVAFLADDARDLIGELRDWVTIDDSLQLPEASGMHARSEFGPVPPNVVVATSGTSGPPRLVDHSWESLLAAARLAEQWHGLGWLMVYDATRWAGIQVWLQALLTGGRLVVPASRDPGIVLKAIVDEGVAVVPTTPTLLRGLISSGDRGLLEKAAVDRITLGGEAADAALLDQARSCFPRAKLSQVYATTELGEVFRVTDGRPGFPATWLGRALPGGSRLSKRRDGELLVQLSRDSAEVGTGDVVELVGDRYLFTGRRSDVIVVSGSKVYPRKLEEILRGVAGILNARVYGLPSALTGELVAAEIVLADPLPAELSPGGVRADALAACRAAVEPEAVPRVLDIVRKIATTAAGKVPRRPVGR